MNKFERSYQRAVVGAGALVLAAPSFAVVDVSDITDAITSAGTAGGVVGLAVLVMIVGMKLFKWIRTAL